MYRLKNQEGQIEIVQEGDCMGTPVPLKSREEQCKGADMTVYTRQLTEEERRYYDSLGKPAKKSVFIFPEDESLYIERSDIELGNNKKIDPPEKDILLEKLAEVAGSKTKAMKHAAEAFAVSMTTMYLCIYGSMDTISNSVKMERLSCRMHRLKQLCSRQSMRAAAGPLRRIPGSLMV